MNLDTAFATLARGTRGIAAICLSLAIVLFAGSLVTMTVDIVLRYAFNHPLQNVGEGITIAFIYVYLLGGAALYARNEDIALDYLFRRAGVKAQALWLLIIHVGIVATMAVVIVQTVLLMQVQHGVRTPALRMPLGIEHAPLAFAAAVICYASLVEAIGCWIWFRSGRRPAVFASLAEGSLVHE
jgi:TRAP-type C4-dicarboxylate transport system permease small subunit